MEKARKDDEEMDPVETPPVQTPNPISDPSQMEKPEKPKKEK